MDKLISRESGRVRWTDGDIASEMWSKSVRADPRNLDWWCPMDELISLESGRVWWTDGRNDGVSKSLETRFCYGELLWQTPHDGWSQMDRLENISTTSAGVIWLILSSWSLDQNAQTDKVSPWKTGGIRLNEWQTKFNWSPMETDGRTLSMCVASF